MENTAGSPEQPLLNGVTMKRLDILVLDKLAQVKEGTVPTPLMLASPIAALSCDH